jgi:hypothetical protein
MRRALLPTADSPRIRISVGEKENELKRKSLE